MTPTLADLDRHQAVERNLRRVHALGVSMRICEAHGADPDAVFRGDRHKYPTRARHHIWTVLRHTLDLSYPEIASIWDVDHTTVMAAIRSREALLDRSYSGVPKRDMAGLGNRLPPGGRVGVEAEQGQRLGGNLAEGEGDEQGATGAEGGGPARGGGGGGVHTREPTADQASGQARAQATAS